MKTELNKAAKSADLLTQNIRAAHKAACADELLLEMILREIITDAEKIRQKLANIEACYETQKNDS